MDKKDDKKVMDFFMKDTTWEMPEKKAIPDQQKEEKSAVQQSEEITDEKKEIGRSEKEFDEVDYAILKSVTYGFKTTWEISKALQIRTLVIEKHIYKLIKNELIKYFDHCVITSQGNQVVEDFVHNNPEDVWKPIDEFILSVIEKRKQRNIKLQKMIDIILLIAMIVLIVLIIYFGIFA